MRRLVVSVTILVMYILLYNPSVSFSVDEKIVDIDEVIKKLESLKGKVRVKENPMPGGLATIPERVSVDMQKEYAWEIEGKETNGEGVVFSVRRERKTKVLILTGASEPSKGYNVVLITKQETGELRKGDKVSFHGKIGHLSNWHGVSLDIAGEYKKRAESSSAPISQ